MNKNVFVYGTLKKGFRNHHYLQEQKLLKENVKLHGFCMYNYHGLYPIAVESKENFIIGEIYSIDEQIEHYLDELEAGYNKHFIDENTFLYTNTIENISQLDIISNGFWNIH